jgi:hypothetical protein
LLQVYIFNQNNIEFTVAVGPRSAGFEVIDGKIPDGFEKAPIDVREVHAAVLAIHENEMKSFAEGTSLLRFPMVAEGRFGSFRFVREDRHRHVNVERWKVTIDWREGNVRLTNLTIHHVSNIFDVTTKNEKGQFIAFACNKFNVCKQ